MKRRKEEEEEEYAKYSKDEGEASENNDEDGDDECKSMRVAAEEHALRSEYEFGFNTELLMPWRLRHCGTPEDAELGLAPKMEALAALPPKNLFEANWSDGIKMEISDVTSEQLLKLLKGARLKRQGETALDHHG